MHVAALLEHSLFSTPRQENSRAVIIDQHRELAKAKKTSLASVGGSAGPV
jgi:hypothetical protein